MILAFSDSTTVTFTVAGLVVALALIALLRTVWKRDPSVGWRRIRIGFFLERDPREGEE